MLFDLIVGCVVFIFIGVLYGFYAQDQKNNLPKVIKIELKKDRRSLIGGWKRS